MLPDSVSRFQDVRGLLRRGWYARWLTAVAGRIHGSTLVLGGAMLLCGSAFLSTSAASAAEPVAAVTPEGIEFFEKKIRPLFATHCYDCHSESSAEAGLALDSWAGLAAGGDSGPTIRPGEANSSLLMLAVGYEDPTLEMPPDGKLSAAEIADLEKWVDMGAPHPDADGAVVAGRSGGAKADATSDEMWALKPMQDAVPPSVQHQQWVANPIDAFVLARLESEGLTPSGLADKRTLIRRATFDLTGLPPTPAEVERFLADDAPDAYARLIDRLLASPAYGERWGRHWLDVARYADSNGLDENIAHGNAWRYRDWVVDAFNRDVPYERFVHQQIAGDLLPADDSAARHENLIATGYLLLGPKVLAEPDKVKMEMDIIDEQIDTLGRSFLGLTFGCARCHDHKFDPILTKDYYSLAGIFKSTLTMDSLKTIARWHENEIPTPEQLAAREQHQQQVAEKEQAVEQLIAHANTELRAQLGEAAAFPDKPEEHYPDATKNQLAELRKSVEELKKAAPEVDSAMGVSEGEPTDLAVHIRGSHLSLGDVAPRAFPDWVPTAEEYEIPDDASGRLQLARWITDPENPLSWRIIVNRLWRWHFGRGLVASVDNFGNLGGEPTHPELLDWLARDFAQSGGSLKRMHRLMMLSNTYRSSSADNPAAREVDPENDLLWRAPLRRLEAEALRDSLLVISGLVDRRMGGSLLHVGNREFLFDHTSKDGTSYDHYVRSLYLPVIRNNMYDGFHLFDYNDASVINGNRSSTTVPTQALFMMNSPLLQETSAVLARRILADDSSASDPTGMLYELAVGRPPTDVERANVQASLEQLIEIFRAAEPAAATEVLAATTATPTGSVPAADAGAEAEGAAQAETAPASETAADSDASGDGEASTASEPPQSTAPLGPPCDRDPAELRAWATICHALLASNEFIYLR